MNDASEKPFEATPRRLIKAKREGNVARSSEFAATLSFAAGALALAAAAPLLGAAIRSALTQAARGAPPLPACALILAVALVPISAAGAASALACLFQNGGVIFVSVALKTERLNPLDGIKRILSRETLFHSVRASLAFACATLAMLPLQRRSVMAVLQASDPGDVAAIAWRAAEQFAATAAVIGLFFSVAEYGAARRAWLRKLRMSFEERKREVKEEEGDTAARGRRRALHRALLRSGFGRIKDASFVVTNPSHVAVALEYRPPVVPVPCILARAVDSAALHLRRVAERFDIPIVQDVWLARALYRDGRTGEAIPHVHYVAVAAVVAALARTNGLDR